MSNTPYLATTSFFVESGTYQPIYMRPYETQYDEQIAQKYYNDTEGGTKIVPAAFSEISSSILRPTAAHAGTINIDNGWNQRRMSFIIEVQVPDAFGGKSVVLTGYTDRTDVALRNNAFDPHMRLYLNTSTVITTMTQRMPNGAISERKSILDSSHLLNMTVMNNIRTNLAMNDTYRENTLWYATPYNVINEMNNIGASASHNVNMFGGDSILDLRQRTSDHEVKRSRRENTVPTAYLSKILRGVSDNLGSMSMGIAEDEHAALTNASIAVKESQLTIDPLIVEIANSTGYSECGFVTWAELNRIVPNLDLVTRYSDRASAVVQTNVPDADAGNFQGWQGVSFETSIANSISQLVPAMMTSCMIGSITFAFSNDNVTATPTVSIATGQTMINGIPFVNMAQTFEGRFLTEVAPMITDQGRTIINMLVQCSLGTETYISISRNGQPEVPFCAPTFCDSLYTPVLAPSQQNLTNIATDLQNIANSVNNVHYMADQRNQPRFMY